MFEEYKLNKYFNCMVGFAYEEINIKHISVILILMKM